MTTRTKHPKIKGKTKAKNKYYTVHFISDPTKSGKSIKIPTWIKYPIIVMVAIIAIAYFDVLHYADSLDQYSYQTSANYEAKVYEVVDKNEEIEKLKKENEEKEQQLKLLQSEVDQVKEMVDKVQSYQDELNAKLSNSIDGDDTEKKINKSETEDKEEQNAVVSVDEPKQALGSAVSMPRTFRSAASSISSDLQTLQMKIDQELAQYGDLENQLDELIPYWEAYPSGYPVDYPEINCKFGWRANPFGRGGSEFHSGVDFEAQQGSKVYATGKGIVVQADYDGSYGYVVVIDHGYGLQTLYAHNSKLLVSVGDEVIRGDLIAKAGRTGRATGTHVHYEVLYYGEQVDPMDYIQ